MLDSLVTLGWGWAAIAFAVYFTISWFVGDLYPFSDYAMYSTSAKRQQGGVPVFLANGVAAQIDDFANFAGIDPEQIYPTGIPCSLEWMVEEFQRWLRTHTAPPEMPSGPVAVTIGFRMMKVDPDTHELVETLRVTAEGTAHPV